MPNFDIDHGFRSPEENGPDRIPSDLSAHDEEQEATQAIPPHPPGEQPGTNAVRLKDLIRGGPQGVGRSQKVGEASQRLRQIPQAHQEGEPPGDNPEPAPGASSEAPLAGLDAVGGPTGASRKPVSREVAFKPLDTANEAFDQAVALMEEIFQSVRAKASFSMAQAEETRDLLRRNLEASDALLLPFFNTEDRSLSLPREAVNVCILSLRIGMELDYSPEESQDLGLAALLHSIGIARLPTTLLERTDPLSQEEQAALKRHPEEGARLIRNLGPGYAWLAEVVLQVHERADGSGYPMGLRGKEIHEHAHVAGIADIYESLVHHRPFRRRFWPPEALKEILQRERTRFPDRILKALIRVMAAFPVGCLVRLNTGEIGRVVAKNADLPLRPVVAILIRRHKRLAEPELIDLSQNALLHVQESVLEEMLEQEVVGVRR